jgi:putative FmdB family regulatory protein
MPTYEYECEECGNTFDVYQSIKAEPIKECPKCCGHVRRLIGAGAGVIFKGSGFYATDYRSENYKKEARKDKDPGKIPSSSSDEKDKKEVRKDKDPGKTPSSSSDKKDQN